MKFKEHLPWFSPDESQEACELLDDIRTVLVQMSTYGPLRKELRAVLSDKARACSEFLGRANQARIERADVLALEAVADSRKVKVSAVLMDVIEAYVSRLNKGA